MGNMAYSIYRNKIVFSSSQGLDIIKKFSQEFDEAINHKKKVHFIMELCQKKSEGFDEVSIINNSFERMYTMLQPLVKQCPYLRMSKRYK